MLIRLLDKLTFYILLFFLVVLSFSLVRNVNRVKRVDSELDRKEAEVEEIRKQGDKLEEQLKIAQSPDFAEKQIRDKLGMSKDGEIVVILPPDDVLRRVAPKYDNEEVILPDPNWKKWMNLFL